MNKSKEFRKELLGESSNSFRPSIGPSTSMDDIKSQIADALQNGKTVELGRGDTYIKMIPNKDEREIRMEGELFDDLPKTYPGWAPHPWAEQVVDKWKRQ